MMKSCLALGRLGFGLPEIQNVPLALACLAFARPVVNFSLERR